MTNQTVISAKDITKTYKLYRKQADRVKEAFHPLRRRYHSPFHALKGVSLEVEQGETIGVVGRNGSGKTTLLQIVCGILKPTAGTVDVQGRISALLELGAGFNPEFTGRQNVYIYGTILGLKKEQITSCFDHIIRFADIGDFIDQPVKTYSSGMYVRLAFAVAANVNPDIFVVDEALSVGDEIFQRKCFARIQEMKEKGVTIFFVSHAAHLVVELCDRALLLDKGELLLTGTPKFVVSKYHQLIYAPESKAAALRNDFRAAGEHGSPEKEDEEYRLDQDRSAAEKGAETERAFLDPNLVPESKTHYESRGAVIGDVQIATTEGAPANVLLMRQDYLYSYTVTFSEQARNVRFGMLIKSISGVDLGGAVSSARNDPIDVLEAHAMVTVTFRFKCLLNPGVYFLNAGVTGTIVDKEVYLNRVVDAAMFRVQPRPNHRSTGMINFCSDPLVTIEYGPQEG